MGFLLPGLVIFLLYLIYERILLNRCLKRIPLRISVTGTRGKSSIARILAAILTEDGRKVLAKTTGSKAMLLLPDGDQIEIRRRGAPTILEQMRIVRMASRLRADCLIAEIMSIHPENHFIESQQILRPDIVVVTNVRLDHTEAMGGCENDIASVLASDITPGSTVFVPESSSHVPISEAIVRSRGSLISVSRGAAATLCEMAPEIKRGEVLENLDLACSVARHLNIEDSTILKGICRAKYDIGKLRVWTTRAGSGHCYLVNAFAANDPESTFRVLSKVLDLLPGTTDRVIGILNLRADRLPRTLQWIEVLKAGAMNKFSRLFVIGEHCSMIRRRLPGADVLAGGSPDAWMATVMSGIPDGALIFGFGNLKGAGMLLVGHWSKIGEDYGI